MIHNVNAVVQATTTITETHTAYKTTHAMRTATSTEKRHSKLKNTVFSEAMRTKWVHA